MLFYKPFRAQSIGMCGKINGFMMAATDEMAVLSAEHATPR